MPTTIGLSKDKTNEGFIRYNTKPTQTLSPSGIKSKNSMFIKDHHHCRIMDKNPAKKKQVYREVLQKTILKIIKT